MTRSRAHWRRLKRVAFFAFLALVAFLLVRAARGIDWAQVREALAAYRPGTLAMAAALSAAGYAWYACYDLAARLYAGHGLPAPRVMATAAVSYAFSLNLGALLGGAGFRYRLYSRAGLGTGTVARIMAFAIATSWVGYLALAGGVFASGQVQVPAQWPVGGPSLRWLGVGLLVALAVYLLGCHLARGRVLHVRGRHFRLPSLWLALLQVPLGAGNWALMAVVLYVLMPPEVSYVAVLGALLVAAVASAIAHIPAGLGVMEAIFLPLLAHQAPQAQVLAALLAFRACYYLGPLLLAVAGYLLLEARHRAGRGPEPPR